MKVWEGYFKKLLNQGGSNGELELPYYVEGEVERMVITDGGGGGVDGSKGDEEGKSARH